MTWLNLTFLSVLFFTLLPLFQRKVAVKSRFSRATAVLFVLSTAPFCVAILLMNGSLKNLRFPSDPLAWVSLLAAVVFYGLFERGRFIAAKKLEASTLSVISNVSLIVAFIGSMFFYSETLTLLKLVGALMIFTALLAISYQGKMKLTSLKNTLIGVLVYSLLGLGWMLDKKGANYFGADIYNFLAWILPIVIVIFPKIKISELKYEIKNTGAILIIPAFLNVAGYFLQLKAMETGNATQIIPIVQTSTLLTVIAGIIFLGEKDAVVKKIFAAVLALIGSYLLVGAV
jgi:drug/metabolite transporter (DMT)-like permease